MKSVCFRMFITFVFLFAGAYLMRAQNVDLAVESCDVPQTVNAGSSVEIITTFKNVGDVAITSFTYSWMVEEMGSKKSMIVSGISIASGETDVIKHKFNLDAPMVNCELNLKVFAVNINSGGDTNSKNDTLSMKINVVNGYKNRLAVIDHFTSVNCGPCAMFNPVLEQLLHKNGNMDKVVYMTIHSNLLGPDPLYNQAKTECDERFGVYRPGGFPTVYLGGKIKGSPDKITQGDIDQDFFMPSYIDTKCNYNIVDGMLRVGGTLKNLKELSSDTKIFFALVETEEFETPPGSNGEVFFPNVLRKFIPDGEGIDPKSLDDQATTSYVEQWELNPEIDIEKSTIYMFVQDVATKEYLAAEKLTYGDIETVGNKCLSHLESEVKVVLNNKTISISTYDDRPITAKLFSINGQLVAETNGTTCYINANKSGIYVLMITDGKSCFSKKTVIK